jgi:hypothetical protein
MTYLKTEFEKKLKEHSFSYQCNTDGLYILCQNNDTSSILNAQLIYSETTDEVIHGSRNNNKIQAIGSFKLRLPTKINDQDFFIFAFQNTSNHCVEYVIIPLKELKRRLNEENRISIDNLEIEIVYWLMPDNCLYDCTNLGVQGEWYYLSRGVNGRMVDGSVWDYSDFLNSWDRLKMT